MDSKLERRRKVVGLAAGGTLVTILGCGGSSDTEEDLEYEDETGATASTVDTKSTFAATIANRTISPSIHSPMAQLELILPDAKDSDKYHIKYRIGNIYTAAVPVYKSIGGNFYITLPPGKFTSNGFSAAPVGIRVYRRRDNVTNSIYIAHRIKPLRTLSDSVQPGSAFRFLAAMQDFVVQEGADRALTSGLISRKDAEMYVIRTHPDFESIISAVPDAAKIKIDTILYNYLLSFGVDIYKYLENISKKSKIKPSTSDAEIDGDWLREVWSDLGDRLGNRARQIGNNITTIAAIIGAIALTFEIAALGELAAVAAAVALLTGTLFGLVFDNLSAIGLSDRYNIKPTLEYFFGKVIADISTVTGPLRNAVDNAATAVDRFLADQINSWGGEGASKIITGTLDKFYKSLISGARNYAPSTPPHSPPPAYFRSICSRRNGCFSVNNVSIGSAPNFSQRTISDRSATCSQSTHETYTTIGAGSPPLLINDQNISVQVPFVKTAGYWVPFHSSGHGNIETGFSFGGADEYGPTLTPRTGKWTVTLSAQGVLTTEWSYKGRRILDSGDGLLESDAFQLHAVEHLSLESGRYRFRFDVHIVSTLSAAYNHCPNAPSTEDSKDVMMRSATFSINLD